MQKTIRKRKTYKRRKKIPFSKRCVKSVKKLLRDKEAQQIIVEILTIIAILAKG